MMNILSVIKQHNSALSMIYKIGYSSIQMVETHRVFQQNQKQKQKKVWLTKTEL